MPISDQASTSVPVTASSRGTAPAQLSRRSMLRGAASAGAAGLALTALAAPAAAAGARAPRPDAAGRSAPLAAAEPLVVHVRDVRTGEMDVYRGTSHARVRDRDLAARLARVTS